MGAYRIKQFIWAVTSHFKSIDKEIPERYLSKEELKVFNNLGIEDKHHCIRVCNDALKNDNSNLDKNKLAKIALLHDIGKVNGSLNIIDKSILVILDKVTYGNLRKYDKYKKVNTYYNHPKESVKILKKINNYDKEFLEAIEKHHYKQVGHNDYLKIIKECDDKN